MNIRKLHVMRMSGKIGMFLAISILMMHSVLPHQHHNQIPDERHSIEHAEANSILDYILLAFHVNPGENHLEEFEKASSISLLFLAVEISECQFIEQPVVVIQSNRVETDHILLQQFLSRQLSFRGPPQLV